MSSATIILLAKSSLLASETLSQVSLMRTSKWSHDACINGDGSSQHHLFGSSEDWTRDIFFLFSYICRLF